MQAAKVKEKPAPALCKLEIKSGMRRHFIPPGVRSPVYLLAFLISVVNSFIGFVIFFLYLLQNGNEGDVIIIDSERPI